MDYGKSFTFVFEDEKWISKFAVGVLITLVPVVNFATYGYMIQLLKNVRDGEERPLPEWDDFGKYFIDGIKFLAGMLAYFVPVILATFLFTLVAIAADAGGAGEEIVSLAAILVTCLSFFLMLLPFVFYPALYIQYAKADQIGDMFRLNDMWELIKTDTGSYVIVLIMIGFVLGIIASFGILLCVIGIFLTAWWAQLVSAHMIGQLARPKEKGPTLA